MVLIWQVVGCSHREGKGYPLQYPCLENPMDREAWWARVHRVTKQFSFRSRLKQFSTHRMSPFSEVKWNPRKDMCPVSDCIRITEGCIKIKIPGAPSCHAEQGRLSCLCIWALKQVLLWLSHPYWNRWRHSGVGAGWKYETENQFEATIVYLKSPEVKCINTELLSWKGGESSLSEGHRDW